MIALFVITETREPAPAPTRASASASAWSSGETRLLELRERRLALDQLHEPVGVAVPVPEERLDLLERAGRDPAQALLGPELEDAVRLEPRLLGPAPVALRGGRLDAVERRGDHVEVRGLGGLVPPLGEDRPGEAEGVLRRRPDRLGRRHPVAARGGGEVVAERRERRLELSRRGGVAAEEDRLEVGERGGRAVAERDRLLDLEVEHDAPVADAASVLDRHELGEAQELAGAPQLLRVGERGGAEALERALEPDERARRGAGVRLADEPGDERVGSRGGGGAALRDVGGAHDAPVAGGRRGGLGSPHVEAGDRRRVHHVERRAETAVVRVQQVGPHRRGSRGRPELALGEPVERERRVGRGAREPRRRAELAHEEPAPGGRGVAARGRGRRLEVRGADDRRPDARPGRRRSRGRRRARGADSARASAARASASSRGLPASTVPTASEATPT